MNAGTLAITLLLLRLVAVALLSIVMARQLKNLRIYTTDYPAVRITVLCLTVTLLVGQIIPIVLDAATAFGTSITVRVSHPPALAASYALNNAIKDVVIGALLCFLYFRKRSTDS